MTSTFIHNSYMGPCSNCRHVVCHANVTYRSAKGTSTKSPCTNCCRHLPDPLGGGLGWGGGLCRKDRTDSLMKSSTSEPGRGRTRAIRASPLHQEARLPSRSNSRSVVAVAAFGKQGSGVASCRVVSWNGASVTHHVCPPSLRRACVNETRTHQHTQLTEGRRPPPCWHLSSVGRV